MVCYSGIVTMEGQLEVACPLKPMTLVKKVKASHSRYRAFGPELILVYRQSARRWL